MKGENLALFIPNSQATDTDSDVGDSDSPVMDAFIASGGAGAVLEMTNFSLLELNAIWNILKDAITTDCNCGRGRKCQHKLKDVFFMLLSTLKHSGNFDFNGKMFGVNPFCLSCSCS